MKMGKKVREYKAGDFIFAKVKGYPAWPARVQKMNGKKYFVYFYGTGETANLPPTMIFDYAENKDKFLTKPVKRRDFNDGVKQIEHDFANNVPLEQVIGSTTPQEPDDANNTIDDSMANETVDDSAIADTTADETMTEENTTQNDATAVKDSDETGALVIDEGKQKPRKSTPKTPAKETPKTPKEVKTPRGRAKKEDAEETKETKEEDKKDEEIVSRSGRKIRPKRYMDEHTEENSTLPSPAPKKRRGASPPVEKEKEGDKEKEKEKEKDKEPAKEKTEKNIKHFNAVPQAELEDLKEPFTPEDAEKENILIAYLPSGQYVGIKLFQSRPNNCKTEAARLQWDKRAASNALTLKAQLEKGQITAQSVIAQLVMDLNLTDEEKATLDKERETEEKKSRVQFLKTEMKLIELDAKIKTCLCLEKADTELCLKLLDELMELDIKPLMLLKHPTCLETIKRMRAYVGNTPSWDLSESAVLLFSQQAHKIRKQADSQYNSMKELFPTPEGLGFWEYFMERVGLFKKATAKMTSDELLELVHEPLEMSTPTSHTMKSAVDAANEEEKRSTEQEEDAGKKAKSTPAKAKKAVNNTPSKPPLKRQSSRRQQEEKEKQKEKEDTSAEETTETNDKEDNTNQDVEMKEPESAEKENAKETKSDTKEKEPKETKEKDNKNSKESKKDNKDGDSKKKDKDAKDKDTKEKESKEKETKDKNSTDNDIDKISAKEKTPEKTDENEGSKKGTDDPSEEKQDGVKETEEKSSDKSDDRTADKKEKVEDEPRAKRSRESKKTEPPPRSPTKRKAKA